MTDDARMTQAGEMALNAGTVGSGKFESFRLNHCASATRKALLLTPVWAALANAAARRSVVAGLSWALGARNGRGFSAETLAAMAYPTAGDIGRWLVWGAENTLTGRENPWSRRAGITHEYASGNAQWLCEVAS